MDIFAPSAKRSRVEVFVLANFLSTRHPLIPDQIVLVFNCPFYFFPKAFFLIILLYRRCFLFGILFWSCCTFLSYFKMFDLKVK